CSRPSRRCWPTGRGPPAASRPLWPHDPRGRPPGCLSWGERPRDAWNAGAVRRSLYVSHGLIDEEGDAVIEGLGADKAHGLLVAGLAEETLAVPEHDRVDLQPQLVDEVVLHQRAQELEAAGDDDIPAELLLQLRNLGHHVALEY